MQAVIKKTGMALGAWSKILSLQPLMLTAILHDTLKFELGQIVALKELFKQRDANVVRVWRVCLVRDVARDTVLIVRQPSAYLAPGGVGQVSTDAPPRTRALHAHNQC